MKILTGRYVFPITSDPIENGAIVIDDTKIVDVGPAAAIKRLYAGVERDDHGDSVILPGFVNCHAHLEVTPMRGLLDAVEHDFRRWLLKLNDTRQKLSSDDLATGALAGAVEALRSGVTCIGDIGREASVGAAALRGSGLRGVVFQETEFSPDARTADDDFEALRKKFEELQTESTELVRFGISPHSPYTVSERLFEHIAYYARENDVKITIHAAESAEEHELLTTGKGFFVEIYSKFGYEWSPPLTTPIDFLARTGILDRQPLLAHCVSVDDADISLIANAGAKIAHCPKSNAKFGHGYAPFEKFLDAGISVGLGSDSVASNNICDMLEEARFAVFSARNRSGRNCFLGTSEALRAATLGGAEALGLSDKIGSLEKGKEADIAVISLGSMAQKPVTDPAAAIVFSSGAKDCIATYVAGKSLFVDGLVTTVNENELTKKLERVESTLRLA